MKSCSLFVLTFALVWMGGIGQPLRAETPAPTQVYVDDDWTGPENCGGHIWNVDAFARIQRGINAAAPGGTVTVAPGTYAQKLVISKPLTVRGPGAASTPNAAEPSNAFAGSSARGQTGLEAGIIPPAVDLKVKSGWLITIASSDVTLDGLTLDGNNPTLGSATDYCLGIANAGAVSNVLITNNIIKNFQGYGMRLGGGGGSVTGNMILNNRIEHIPGNGVDVPGIGISIGSNYFAEVVGNTITQTPHGIIASNFTGAGMVKVLRNKLDVDDCGICLLSFTPKADETVQPPSYDSEGPDRVRVPQSERILQIVKSPGAEVANNLIRVLGMPTNAERADYNQLHCHAGIRLLFLHTDEPVTLKDNTVTGGHIGLLVVNPSSPHATTPVLTVYGGTLANCEYGIKVTNNNLTWGKYHGLGVKYSALIVDGVQITDATVAGILAEDDAANGANTLAVVLTNGTTVSGGPVGVVVRGRRMQLKFTRVGAEPAATFSGQRDAFITLQSNGVTAPGTVDATTVSFLQNGTSVLGQALDEKITDQTDQTELGQVQLP